jgi:beta-galactosidase
LRDCLAEGGRALFLPGSKAALQFGWTTATNTYRGASELPAWPELAGISLSDLRPRTDLVCPLLVAGEGAETAANGALGRIHTGNGVAMFVQLDPDALDADTKTYLRYTRWRFTRVLSQLLANLGGSFSNDQSILTFAAPEGMPIVLGGEWRYEIEHRLDRVPSPAEAPDDPGIRNLSVALPAYDDRGWKTVTLPAMLENVDGELRDRAWTAWFRRCFEAPAGWTNQAVVLNLGVLDDFDQVYLNGVKIAATGRETGDWWSKSRSYPLPPGTLKAGTNVLAIRIFNNFGGGGFGAATPDALHLALKTPPRRASPYYPDYREDHAQGDDPARYYRW